MNHQRLIRHYPELENLTPATQAAILEAAHSEAFGQQQKLHNWRRNTATFAVIFIASVFFVSKAGPALGLSGGVTAALMILVILPLFIYTQHRRYIAQLRPFVQHLASEQKT